MPGQKQKAVSVGELLRAGEKSLTKAGMEAPDRQTAWILGHLLGKNRIQLLSDPGFEVPYKIARAFHEMIARRLGREPLQYILGFTEFFGLRIVVTTEVLIPRPETEQLVEKAIAILRNQEDASVLDIGTGSGCIALALKHELPGVQVDACDVSPQALAIASQNSRNLDLQVSFFSLDILTNNISVPRRYSLLVSNPPYIPPEQRDSLMPEVRDFEPDLALFSDSDALQFYRAIVGHAKTLLRPSGCVLFEVHADYGNDVRELLTQTGFEETYIDRDLAGLPRVVGGKWSG